MIVILRIMVGVLLVAHGLVHPFYIVVDLSEFQIEECPFRCRRIP